MDIAEFLLARIAEDEARVKDVWKRPHWAVCNTQGDLSSLGDTCDCGLPARVLAECEAKRRIIKLMRDGYSENDVEFWALHDALQFLALPYADHPDFQPEWSPHATV